MGIQQPIGTDKLNSPAHSLSHRVFANDDSADVKTIVAGTGGKVGVGVDAPTAVLHLKAGTASEGTAPLKLTSGAALTTPETGAIEFHDDRFYITNKSVRKAIDRTSDVVVETVTVVNEATETELWHSSQPANSLVAGNIMKFHADGVVSTGAVNQDFVLRVRLGSIAGAELVSLTVSGKKLDDDNWHMDANATQRTIGVNGSRAYHVHLDVNGTDEQKETGVVDIDTEDTMDLYVTIDWDTASADNSISLYQAYMEYKN